MELHFSKEEARLFHLYALRLHGHRYPEGEEGVRECFADLDVLQLDPLPVLSRSHDLVIQARVDGTHPGQVLDLVHSERLGFEYWDKVLSLIPVEHYPWFRPWMEEGGEAWEREREKRLRQQYPGAIEAVYAVVEEHGPISSKELQELKVAQEAHRGWKATRVANVALVALWNRGKISVSQRKSFRRYFDLTERIIPASVQKRRSPSLERFWPYLLSKRVANAGLLPLGGGMESWAFLRQVRTSGLPEKLVEADKLALVKVEGLKTPFLAPADAEEQLEHARSAPLDGRVRFLSPLDPLVWSRNVLKGLWDFEYAWEVYKPAPQRRWGYYVLPVICGDRFVARFDGKYDTGSETLQVLAYHEEPGGLSWSDPLMIAAFERFLAYLGGERVSFPNGEVYETSTGS
jgi:uncharacterized protein YcaQ